MDNQTVALSSDGGFTLIEFLVAIVILTVGMLGLLQAVNVAVNNNLQNVLRNEAVMVGDGEMAKEIANGFELASVSIKNYTVSRRVLNGFKSYSVARTGVILQNSKQINYEVIWYHKGIRYTHGASTVISNSNQ
jgi:type IV pilus assembly protein PilV